MNTGPPQFSIEYRPLHLEYSAFIRCNDLCFADEPMSEGDFERYRSENFWAAHLGRELIGYGIATDAGTKWRIKRMAVDPGHRGSGFGQCLLSAMIQRGADAGCEALDLSVQQDNPAAIHIYEKAGFRTVGESYQYVVDIEKLKDDLEHTKDSGAYTVAPITQYDRDSLPGGVARWYDAYSYPGSQVLVFGQREVGHIGFCRLNPDFPGCSPFEIWQPDVRLGEILALLDDCLIPGKRRLKLTFADPSLAARSEEEGFRLNYKLFEMSMNPRRV